MDKLLRSCDLRAMIASQGDSTLEDLTSVCTLGQRSMAPVILLTRHDPFVGKLGDHSQSKPSKLFRSRRLLARLVPDQSDQRLDILLP